MTDVAKENVLVGVMSSSIYSIRSAAFLIHTFYTKYTRLIGHLGSRSECSRWGNGTGWGDEEDRRGYSSSC